MKRKSGLQKNISSIFKNCPVDDLDSNASLPPFGQEQEQVQTSSDEPIEITLESKSSPIVDPPDFTLETPDTRNQDHTLLQEDAQAESEQNDKVRKITDDGLSYFSFTGAEQAPEDATADDTLDQEHAEIPEPAIQLAVPTPRRATIKRFDIDKRQMLMVSLVGILSVVFVLALFWTFVPSLFKAKKQNQPGPLDRTPLPTVQAQSPEHLWPKPPLYPQELRDPMRPVVMTKPIEALAGESQQNLNLVGIVFSEDKPSVIIGEKILFVGDVVDGATIISIGKNEVVFKSNSKQWTQSL